MDSMDAFSLSDQVEVSTRSLGWRRLALPLTLVVTSIFAMAIDIRIASLFKTAAPHQLREFLEICETFGHGYGVTLILFAVVVLDPAKLKCLPWLISGSLGSGMMANLLKLTIHRIRPRDFDLTNATVWDTFSRGNGDLKGMQSMPSAHTATAVGLAVMLSAVYPRGRWFFAVLAILVGLQRITTSAHFPSDVCAGAAVGCLFGMISCLSMKSQFGKNRILTQLKRNPTSPVEVVNGPLP
jgi:membrane-associated phospholipid phosphatase